jgi:hypothetical protein
MKRAVAIVLSLILIGIQALAAVQLSSDSSAQKKSSCCSSRMADCCCVTESNSAPSPLPAVTTPLLTQNNFSTVLSMLVVWILPESAPLPISSSASELSTAHALPLFQRDCALLI